MTRPGTRDLRTRWGSLYHYFKRMMQIRKALDVFCCLADDNVDVPELEGGKQYSYYKLSNDEWNIIRRCTEALEIVSKLTTELGKERLATCQKVFPILERAQIKWEELLADANYAPVAPALQAGLYNMKKWYCTAIDSPIYFICHVLDPARKLSFLNKFWETEWIEHGKDQLEHVVSLSDYWISSALIILLSFSIIKQLSKGKLLLQL
ncbi:hypothetical protein BT96DRAFT_399375 [Gymnopus androsaceus JB14]|uniref:hAT-like transposase RNase-H fold domain-containing protein n=1 Tax=Gymnopus androsaceus JB14 TaxID=1447944 RepID=A0A6A4GUK8_9AGAR|nr:hypothetical protein BT96DRAFT_399375 [Gymnopus androsaceus JB14]